VLLCGCLPFDDDSSRIPSEQQARARFVLRFPKWANNLSAPAKDLLQHLLDVNPNTRYKAEDALRHPWVTGKSVTPNSYLASPSMIGQRLYKYNYVHTSKYFII
jgi:calcium/calmodulin-dependent protein kinase I